LTDSRKKSKKNYFGAKTKQTQNSKSPENEKSISPYEKFKAEARNLKWVKDEMGKR